MEFLQRQHFRFIEILLERSSQGILHHRSAVPDIKKNYTIKQSTFIGENGVNMDTGHIGQRP